MFEPDIMYSFSISCTHSVSWRPDAVPRADGVRLGDRDGDRRAMLLELDALVIADGVNVKALV